MYASATWALAPAELERLEVVQRGMMRQALKRKRRDISNTDIYRVLRVPTVATLWARAQLRWLGHLARADEGRLARKMLGAVRVESGRVGHGNRGASLLGCFGAEGALAKVIKTNLTPAARRRFFGDVADGKRVATQAWYMLAQNKAEWRNFIKSVRSY